MSLFTNANYLLDEFGNYLRILGNYHDNDAVYSYVQYYPSKIGHRTIKDEKYGYSSFVQHSFEFFAQQPGRYRFSPYHGEVMIITPLASIKSIFDCRSQFKYLIDNPYQYSHLKSGRELTKLIDILDKYVNLDLVGITGSFLLDHPNDASDIDLVCYGKDGFFGMKKFFEESSFIIPYRGEDAIWLYNHRKKHMNPMKFDLFEKQEGRKLIGMTSNERVHIVCQPQRGDEICLYEGIPCMNIGEITCLLVISDHQQGYYAPAYYDIEVQHIFEGFSQSHANLQSQIKVLISHQGFYANSFRQGDLVHVTGKLILFLHQNEPTYGIEVSSLGKNQIFQAQMVL